MSITSLCWRMWVALRLRRISRAGSGVTRSTFSVACRSSARRPSPSEDVPYLVRRLADDRPLPERARLVAKQLVGGQKRFGLAAANLCEGGRLLARRLHLPDSVALALGQVTERWDGKGVPGAAAGEEISLGRSGSCASCTTSSRSPRRATMRRRSRR